MCETKLVVYKCEHNGGDNDVAILRYCENWWAGRPCQATETGGERFKAPGLCTKCQKEMADADVNDLYWLHKELEKGGREKEAQVAGLIKQLRSDRAAGLR